MTYTDAQHLLAFLKFYKGQCDGIWGPLSKKAMTEFQARFGGLEPNGQLNEDSGKALRHAVAYMYDEADTVPETTGNFWDEIEFFDREEFRCQCGGKYCNGFPVEPQELMVRTVNEIRRRLGVPITIVESGGSGVRCKQHNANVGGVANSLHLTGNAADLHSSASPEKMASVAEEVMGHTGEIGIYSWGIHVGIGGYSRFRG